MKISKHLEEMSRAFQGRVRLGDICEQMRHSGFGLIILFLSLPFMQPIPMAGLSTAFGGIIALLGVQLVLNRRSVWIPTFVANKQLSSSMTKSLLDAATKFFRFVETFVRPRLGFVAHQERLLGVVIVLCAFLLMLPIPIPFSNLICAVPIALMALALLERDGVMAILGVLGCLFSIFFHVAIFVLGFEGFKAILERFLGS